MEEKRRAINPRQRKHQNDRPDYFLFVTLVQCAVCALVFTLLLLLSRGSSDRAEGLRRDFALLMSRELQMEDVETAVGAIRDYFMPQAGTVAVMAQPDGETTAPQPAAESTEPAAVEETAADEAPTQPVSTQTISVTAAPDAQAVGGDDGDEQAAKKNTSFSSSAVTVPITRPVEGGRYSSYFGYRNNPITHQYAFHTGLDIAVPEGTMIRAAYGGTVRLVGEDSRSGKYVTITHDDGYETFYCHCSKTLVTVGTVVRAGEAVACVGSTGWATGPHLHFEIRKNGTKLDPLQILEA